MQSVKSSNAIEGIVTGDQRITKKALVEATLLGSLTAMSKSAICKIHPDISPTTVEAILGAMVKDGRTRKIGSARNTKYSRNL